MEQAKTFEGRVMINFPSAIFAVRHRLYYWLASRGGVLLFATASGAFAQQDYKTPQDAVDALIAAARNGDEKALLFVLGPDGDDIFPLATKSPTRRRASASLSFITPSTRSR